MSLFAPEDRLPTFRRVCRAGRRRSPSVVLGALSSPLRWQRRPALDDSRGRSRNRPAGRPGPRAGPLRNRRRPEHADPRRRLRRAGPTGRGPDGRDRCRRIVTGRFSLRRVPLPILGLLACFLVLNLVSAIFANNPARAAFFLMITVYLSGFGVWIPAFVDSARRARILITPCRRSGRVVGDRSRGPLSELPRQVGSGLLGPPRARGFFKDPNVFGPFCVFVRALPRLRTARAAPAPCASDR